MRIVFILSLSFISTLLFSQSKERVLLEWKIPKNDTLKYKTTMNAVHNENIVENKEDTTSVFSGKDFEKFRKTLSEIKSSFKYQSNLFLNRNDKNLIDIEMLMFDEVEDYSKEKSEKLILEENKPDEIEKDTLNVRELYKNLINLSENIVLRGRVSKFGELTSTYYKNSQKNLISILFELPNKEVEIGEKWKLNLNLIEMDHNFFCDSLSNTNEVYIEKILKTKEDKIAIIKYNIKEYVNGNYNNPMGGMIGMDTNKKIFMQVTHEATGFFSLTNGKWINYEGEMKIESNFPMFGSGKSKTIFKLYELQ